jgi:hypothetical protein
LFGKETERRKAILNGLPGGSTGPSYFCLFFCYFLSWHQQQWKDSNPRPWNDEASVLPLCSCRWTANILMLKFKTKANGVLFLVLAGMVLLLIKNLIII